MSTLAWILANLGVPVSAVAAAALLGAYLQVPLRISSTLYMRRVRAAQFRSRTPGGSEPTPDGRGPQPSSGYRAGVELTRCPAPPAPSTLVGVACPRPATPTRPHPVAAMGEPACAYHMCGCGATP